MTVLLAASAIERWAPTYRAWVLIGGGFGVLLCLIVFIVAVARAVAVIKVQRDQRREENG